MERDSSGIYRRNPEYNREKEKNENGCPDHWMWMLRTVRSPSASV
jgi:hypothetical protein